MVLYSKDPAGGVAWSIGQHRRLPLQGSAGQISALPLFFNFKIESKSKSKSRRSEARGGETMAMMKREGKN